jgi:OPA family glycerol-3-phosphate transporter-like MFS transporter
VGLERVGAKHGVGALWAAPWGHWYSIGERGTKFAFWNVAQNVGGGLTGLIVAYSTVMLGWRSAFYVPGILAMICAIYLLIRLRDTPQSVGLPSIEEYHNDYPSGDNTDCEKELGHSRFAGQLHFEE